MSSPRITVTDETTDMPVIFTNPFNTMEHYLMTPEMPTTFDLDKKYDLEAFTMDEELLVDEFEVQQLFSSEAFMVLITTVILPFLLIINTQILPASHIVLCLSVVLIAHQREYLFKDLMRWYPEAEEQPTSQTLAERKGYLFKERVAEIDEEHFCYSPIVFDLVFRLLGDAVFVSYLLPTFSFTHIALFSQTTILLLAVFIGSMFSSFGNVATRSGPRHVLECLQGYGLGRLALGLLVFGLRKGLEYNIEHS